MAAADFDVCIGDTLAEQLDRLLSAEVDARYLAAIESGGDNNRLWARLEELGLQYAMAGGEYGAQLSWQQSLPLLQTLGSHGAPAPLAEAILANKLLTAVGLEVISGTVAVCTNVVELGEDGRLYGSDSLVPWLPTASNVTGIASSASGRVVFVANVQNLTIQSVETLARLPTGSVQFDGVEPTVTADAGIEVGADGLRPQLALVRAVQISGVCNRVLALTIDYANTRSQFGRPIGKFQAVQHLVADLAVQAATAQAAVAYGCRTADEGHALQGAAVAKQLASAAASECARIAHQVFGAIGVTEEHELHHLTRRLWQWRQEGGSEHEWSEELGRALMNAGADNLWSALVGESHSLP